jgi:FixJ family two-component response regulator
MDAIKTQVIAIVDDDESVRRALRTLLKSYGFQARAFASAEEFLQSGQQTETACLISDIRMGGMGGLELQSRLARENSTLPIIFITAHADCRTRLQAMRSGAIQFLEKPFSNDVLIASINAALNGVR